jgi:hypothetical protein
MLGALYHCEFRAVKVLSDFPQAVLNLVAIDDNPRALDAANLRLAAKGPRVTPFSVGARRREYGLMYPSLSFTLFLPLSSSRA